MTLWPLEKGLPDEATGTSRAERLSTSSAYVFDPVELHPKPEEEVTYTRPCNCCPK
jgi:hypothetical protein